MDDIIAKTRKLSVFCEDPELYRRTDDAGPEQPIGPELDPGEGRGFPYSELHIAKGWIPDAAAAAVSTHPLSSASPSSSKAGEGAGAAAAGGGVAFNCQDAAVVQRHFAGEPSCEVGATDSAARAFAGVFDGHGKYGKEAAAFVRDELPLEIASDKSALIADPIAAVSAAARRVHVRLLDVKSADGPRKNMSFSGSTACFVLSLGVAERGGWSGRNAGGKQGADDDPSNTSKSQSWTRFLWGGGSGKKLAGGSSGKNALGGGGGGGGGGELVHRLLVGSVGNSKAVLCGGGELSASASSASGSASDRESRARALTTPHDPADGEESRRILESGGELRTASDNAVHRLDAVGVSPIGEPLRVYAKGALFPGIAMSRSLGDKTASMLGVIPDPAVSLHEVPVRGRGGEAGTGGGGGGGGGGGDSGPFVLLGTDGLWEVFSPEDAVELIEKTVSKGSGTAGGRGGGGGGGVGAKYEPQADGRHSAARALVEEAQRLTASRDPDAAVDDVTALAVWLSTPPFADSLLLSHPIPPGSGATSSSRGDQTEAGQWFSDSGDEEISGDYGGGGDDARNSSRDGGRNSSSYGTKKRSMERRKAVSSEPFSSNDDLASLCRMGESSAFYSPAEISPSSQSREGGSSTVGVGGVGGSAEERRGAAAGGGGGGGGGDDSQQRQDGASAHDHDGGESAIILEHPKDEATIVAIKSALCKHFLFKGLTSDVLNGIVRQMFEVTVAPGQRLIQQGATGDNMYVCTEGRLDCHVSNPGSPEPGPKVMEYGPGSSFGELTLMYDCPRPSTVQASAVSHLWVIDRAIAKANAVQVLAETPVLSALTEKQLTDLAGQVRLLDIADAPSVVHMSGTRIDGFYIVLEGSLAMRWGDGGGCHPLVASQPPRVVRRGATIGRVVARPPMHFTHGEKKKAAASTRRLNSSCVSKPPTANFNTVPA